MQKCCGNWECCIKGVYFPEKGSPIIYKYNLEKDDDGASEGEEAELLAHPAAAGGG